MNKLIIFLCLIPQICSSQIAPIDTIFLLFEQNSDSVCTIFTTSGIEAQTTTIKTFRKNAKYKDGKIVEITFFVCNEEFVYTVEKHTSETLPQNSVKNIKYSTLSEARRKIHEIDDNLNANYDKTNVIYAYPKDMLVKVFIVEKQADQKFVKYETDWIEKIE